jgi:hypothetical protein
MYLKKQEKNMLLMLTLRNGTVLVLRNGSLLSQPAGVLPVAGQSGERGLLDALAAAGGVRQPVNKMTLQHFQEYR